MRGPAIQVTGGGLHPVLSRLSPSWRIGPDVPEYSVRRVARGATYEITVKNSGANSARARLVVDGQEIEGNEVPYAPAGAVVRIEATL